MKRLAFAALLSACTSNPAAPDLAQAELRGSRYCEVLLATAAPPNVHVDVYNTFGLNDCPDAAWTQLDPAELAADHGATFAQLNGPRYWVIDRFADSTLQDPTVVTFGGLDMRKAGSIDLALSDAQNAAPYTPRHVQRHTTFDFDGGKPVFELVDPTGAIYDMQSWSIQKIAQTDADLATLGARLTLPANWTFRARTLAADLAVTAVNDLATVIQDDFGNTYQLSQQ